MYSISEQYCHHDDVDGSYTVISDNLSLVVPARYPWDSTRDLRAVDEALASSSHAGWQACTTEL